MVRIRTSDNFREVRAALKSLSQRDYPRAVRTATKITVFGVAKDLRKHAESVFPTRGGKFLAKGIRGKMTRGKAEGTVAPRGRAAKTGILAQQEQGGIIRADGPVERLDFGGKLAIPLTQKRSARGRVRRGPAQVAEQGFVSSSGRALIQRSRRGKTKVAFALVERARIDSGLDYMDTGLRRVRKRFPDSVRRAVSQIRSRR